MRKTFEPKPKLKPQVLQREQCFEPELFELALEWECSAQLPYFGPELEPERWGRLADWQLVRSPFQCSTHSMGVSCNNSPRLKERPMRNLLHCCRNPVELPRLDRRLKLQPQRRRNILERVA